MRVAGLEMHPKDVLDRTEQTRDEGGLGYCNITKCCTEVCPEHIHITDNAIIPLKERRRRQALGPGALGGAQGVRQPRRGHAAACARPRRLSQLRDGGGAGAPIMVP